MSNYKVGDTPGCIVSMKMTQKQAGALYMQYVKASNRVKELEARIAELEQVSAPDAKDAARWRKTLMCVGGATGQYDSDYFTVNIRPVPGANIMRGGVSQHFTEAVDAAMAKGVQS